MYKSKLSNSWAVVYCNKYNEIVIEEFITEAEADNRMAELK